MRCFWKTICIGLLCFNINGGNRKTYIFNWHQDPNTRRAISYTHGAALSGVTATEELYMTDLCESKTSVDPKFVKEMQLLRNENKFNLCFTVLPYTCWKTLIWKYVIWMQDPCSCISTLTMMNEWLQPLTGDKEWNIKLCTWGYKNMHTC